ncbi:MAG: hypothetical protein MUC28_00105 [Planctomycetes bacterium]|jgi:SAM-dependent methyltransferase|nr:hypothetical protein [Planctomycetota bacterium]
MAIFLIYSAILALFGTFAWAAFSLAPFVPTRKRDLPRIFSLARLRPEEIFYDLGCGDGRVVMRLSRLSPARFIGLEIALPLVFLCLARKWLGGGSNTVFKWKNVYAEDLSAADAVYLFVSSPEKLQGRLVDKLSRELKRGSRVISYAFPVAGWTPTLVDKPRPQDIAIYLYTL